MTSEHQPKRCPICGKEVDEPSEHFPFCSERCRLVDLGRWFKGSYTISRPADMEDDSEEPS